MSKIPEAPVPARETADRLQDTADRNQTKIQHAIENTKNSGLFTRESTADLALTQANDALRDKVQRQIALVEVNLEANQRGAADRLLGDLQKLFTQQHEMSDLVAQWKDADGVASAMAKTESARSQAASAPDARYEPAPAPSYAAPARQEYQPFSVGNLVPWVASQNAMDEISRQTGVRIGPQF